MKGVISEGKHMYQRKVSVYPVPHYYNELHEPKYIKWGCPVCELIVFGFNHQVAQGASNCPQCNVNLNWEGKVDEMKSLVCCGEQGKYIKKSLVLKNETRLMDAIAEAMNRLDGVLMSNHSTYELNLAASEVSTRLHAVYHGATWEAAGLEEGERDE